MGAGGGAASAAGGGSNSAVDWTSAISSLVAAIIGVVTLVTVYLAAVQILTQRQIYQLGISPRALGAWRNKVVLSASLFHVRMQTQIQTPKITLPGLVQNGWKPRFTFPLAADPLIEEPGLLSRITPGSAPRPDSESQKTTNGTCLAETSWVNFLQALGLGPTATQSSKPLVDMQSQPDLVNGIVPMRWKGKDLVAICSLLGFQSFEDSPSVKTPMPLPMQWSGPLGWIQFRASSDGCIAEFRRRAYTRNSLPVDAKGYFEIFFQLAKFKHAEKPSQKDILMLSLWRTVHGMYIPADDEHDELETNSGEVVESFKQKEKPVEDQEKSVEAATETPDKEKPIRVVYLGGSNPLDKDEDANKRSPQKIFQHGLNTDLTDDDAQTLIYGKYGMRPDDVRSGLQYGQSLAKQKKSALDELLASRLGKRPEEDRDLLNKAHVLKKCPGLLSVTTEGEYVDSRGLGIEDALELERVLVHPQDVDRKTHRFKLGWFFMDDKILTHMKKGLIHMRPWGFYFAAPSRLASDIKRIYAHVDKVCNILIKFEPDLHFPDDTVNGCVLNMALQVCHSYKDIRANGRANFSIEDMGILADACDALLLAFGSQDPRAKSNWKHERIDQLRWAFLIVPGLFTHVARCFSKLGLHEICAMRRVIVIQRDEVRCRLELPPDLEDGILNDDDEIDCDFIGDDVWRFPYSGKEEVGYAGGEVLAAYLYVFLTFFWIEESAWVSDISAYNSTIPNSVTMC
ncbi:hypothetical protein DFH27DRAFT_514978 [Peziza echinospora]|nr:hypothetical protein DFH27DRAFT_514978 [Peziza echinospora]